MDDARKWPRVWARFEALQNHPPTFWDENAVCQYHEIVTALEEAWPGEDLSAFRVPDSQLKHKVVGGKYATRHTPGTNIMSTNRYCDEQYIHRQMEGIVLYFQNRQIQPEPEPPKFGF